MKTIFSISTFLMTLLLPFANSPAQAQLLIDEARTAKNKTDQILTQLNIPTTPVDVYFPRSYVKAALDQMIVDLPKIETKVTDLLRTQNQARNLELSISAHSGRALYRSCQNKISTSAKLEGQIIPHTLTLIPADRGIITRLGEEWLVEVNGSEPVTLAIQIDGNTTNLSPISFEVLNLPTPNAQWGTLAKLSAGTGEVLSSALRSQSRLNLVHSQSITSSCATFTPYTIASYRVRITTRTESRSLNQNGSSLAPLQGLLQTVRSGDQLFVNQIKLQHPDLNETEVFAPNLNLQIK